MHGPTRVYEGAGITVIWDATRCIHVAECLRALPSVFDTRRRPWVAIDAAPPSEVAAAVRLCPTGALRYTSPAGDDAVEDEPAVTDGAPVIEASANGPFLVRGAVRVVDADGNVVADETRLALCRCGRSGNKPFCDNTHLRVGFEG